MLAGYAKGVETAVDIEADLIAAKKQQLADLQNRLTAASALFGLGLNNAGVYALHVSGAGGNALLKSELLTATGSAGHELSFCAGVAWVGVDGSLSEVAGVLGV